MLREAALNLAAGLIPDIVDQLSPQVREHVERGLLSWWEKAKQTENPWDNYAVALIAGVLGTKLKG